MYQKVADRCNKMFARYAFYIVKLEFLLFYNTYFNVIRQRNRKKELKNVFTILINDHLIRIILIKNSLKWTV